MEIYFGGKCPELGVGEAIPGEVGAIVASVLVEQAAFD